MTKSLSFIETKYSWREIAQGQEENGSSIAIGYWFEGDYDGWKYPTCPKNNEHVHFPFDQLHVKPT